MNKPTVLLRLRWLQLRRALPVYGLVVLLICIALVPLFVKALLESGLNMKYYVGGAVTLGLAGWHQRRPDLGFVRKHVLRPYRELTLEYLVFSLPVLIGFGISNAWREGLVLLLLVLLLPRSPVVHASKARMQWLRQRLSQDQFEWKSAVQRSYPFGILLWVMALAFCWLPILPLFLLWFLCIQLCEMQSDCEPRSMLFAAAPNAHKLLRRKLFGGIKLVAVLLFPPLIGATLFQPHWWWLHLLFALGMMILVALSIMLKYSNYTPNERLMASGPVIAVAGMFAVMPGLFLVPLFMMLNERRKAIDNLQTFYHAHHS